MQQLHSRHDSGAGASVPHYTLRTWVSCSASFWSKTGAGAAGTLKLGWKQHSVGVRSLHTYSAPPSYEWDSHREWKGSSSKGKHLTVMPDIFILWINLHQIITDADWQSRYAEGDSFHWLSKIKKRISLYKACMQMTRGKRVTTQEEGAFNLGEITKGGQKTALDAGMPLGGTMPLLCWKGRLSWCVGQLETGGFCGGGSKHNNLHLKCCQLSEQDKQLSQIWQQYDCGVMSCFYWELQQTLCWIH